MEADNTSSQPSWESDLRGEILTNNCPGRTKVLSWRLFQLMGKNQRVCCSGAAAGLSVVRAGRGLCSQAQSIPAGASLDAQMSELTTERRLG